MEIQPISGVLFGLDAVGEINDQAEADKAGEEE
jgi:hypothetical protein